MYASPRCASESVAEKVTDDALKLSLPERALLARKLLLSLEESLEESMGADEMGDVQRAWDAEVGRRVEDIRAGRAQGRPADQVFADIRARYGR